MILLSCMLCTGFEAQKIHLAQTLVNQVTRTQCFADSMYAQGIGDYWIDAIKGARQNLPVYFYRQNNNVVGFMNPGSPNIYLNRTFHDSFTACKTGSNVTHELVHVLGFRHKADVAYAANYAFEQCCEE